MMRLKTLFFASLLGLLLGCSPQAGSQPTAFPPDYLPTVVVMTGQAAIQTSQALTPTPLPTETPAPTLIPATPTFLPTATPTFAPGFDNFAQIYFISPGPMSSVVSPIQLKVLLVSGESQIVQVDLLGENGRLLQRILERVDRNLAGNYRSFELMYETRAVSEKGFIRISSKDSIGKVQTLNTMPVLLYSIGNAQINPVGNMIYERISLDGLKEGDEISGGEIKLKGRFWPFNNYPLFISLVMPDGKTTSSRVINLKGTDTHSFETTLPYKVGQKTIARILFNQENPELNVAEEGLPNYIYAYSLKVILFP